MCLTTLVGPLIWSLGCLPSPHAVSGIAVGCEHGAAARDSRLECSWKRQHLAFSARALPDIVRAQLRKFLRDGHRAGGAQRTESFALTVHT